MKLINAGSVKHIQNVQAHSIILHQDVSFIPVTVIRWLMIRIQSVYR